MKIMQRLDTGMFYLKKDDGTIFSNANGVVYFSDIIDAEKMKSHIDRHSKAFAE